MAEIKFMRGYCPQIYAFTYPNVPSCVGRLKVGYTSRPDVEDRVREQFTFPDECEYRILLQEVAIRNSGTSFKDIEVHKELKRMGKTRLEGEWFECSVEDVQEAINTVKAQEYGRTKPPRDQDFSMRPEQEKAVKLTEKYFRAQLSEDPGPRPRFLWNAKMRFGKTFSTYQLAKSMEWNKILVITYKPAVKSSWRDDLERHIDFKDWRFVDLKTDRKPSSMNSNPLVCFGSFQDLLGRTDGKIKTKNEWIHASNWDLIVLDEIHYGAWRENAKELMSEDDPDWIESDDIPITGQAILHLSGTPFKALTSGEFMEDQIYNWTYSDEQKAKKSWEGDPEANPYKGLPEMRTLLYSLPRTSEIENLKDDSGDLNLGRLFEAVGEGYSSVFKYETSVKLWLDVIQGIDIDENYKELAVPASKVLFPFQNSALLSYCQHSVWVLPSVSSCYAMEALLQQIRKGPLSQYEIIVVAGDRGGVGAEALETARSVIKDGFKTKTITLTCGKLLTGVTVPQWSSMFMLRNCKSPETYFQAAFRVQSPWMVDGLVKKEHCYIFDFSPVRSLKQMVTYSSKLQSSKEDIPVEESLKDFVKHLPVIAFDGTLMKPANVSDMVNIAFGGVTATLLAQRWKSGRLLDLSQDVLRILVDNEAVMDALAKITHNRNINNYIRDMVEVQADVEVKKQMLKDDSFSKAEKSQLKKEIGADKKDLEDKRKEIRKKLEKFLTRLPLFMYLTDTREKTVVDLIECKENRVLFQKVCAITQEDFAILKDSGVFNSETMNLAVKDFKRYEDSSLDYIGTRTEEEVRKVMLWDREE